MSFGKVKDYNTIPTAFSYGYDVCTLSNLFLEINHDSELILA